MTMLYAMPPKKNRIEKVESVGGEFILSSQAGKHRLSPRGEKILRITYTEREQFSDTVKPGVLDREVSGDWTCTENEQEIVIASKQMKILICRETGSYKYYRADGSLLLQETDRDSKCLESFQSYRLDPEHPAVTKKVETPDGIKELVTDAVRVSDELLYHTRWNLQWQEGEALYGLGQQEEGLLNLRGNTVYLHQANRKIAVPMLVSTLGYGVLMDTYSPMIFNDTVFGSYLYTEADEELDYYFICGDTMEDVVKGYRRLTGKASLLPKWAYGYVQSQERYETAQELLDTAQRYRQEGIGLDCLVLDWCSWEDGMWGQKSFDGKRFPDPKAMTDALHDKNVHFMISIWPNMDEHCANYIEMKEQGQLLDAANVYNAFSVKGRELYWKQVNEGLFCHGVDAWWCDSSEPFTPEWSHVKRVEPAAMYEEFCREASNHMPVKMTNAFALFHAMALKEGQRSTGSEKRVCNLTRSAYTGQQRYGTIMWSGDIAATWDTYRKQIANGLNFSVSGIPYWTVDVGAFFVKKSTFWYWDGDYDKTTEDEGYLELYTRWYQWAAFLPVFRAHGTDCRRELWEYKGKDGRFYEAMKKINAVRYQLMPYIYSQAGRTWLEDQSMMRPLAFDYQDKEVYDIKDQYLFGDSLMICPVTEPMYYGKNSTPLEGVEKSRKVYLPAGHDWYDFWTQERYSGGQWITSQAEIDTIPVFVKAGSILPMSEGGVCAAQAELNQLVVYPGKDGQLRLYEDAGDGYGYEEGAYELTVFNWTEQTRELTGNARQIPVRIVE